MRWSVVCSQHLVEFVCVPRLKVGAAALQFEANGWMYWGHRRMVAVQIVTADRLLFVCLSVCGLQVGHEAAEATGGTMSTTELAGHTDSVVSVAFNASGQLL